MKWKNLFIVTCLMFLLSSCRDYTSGQPETKADPINIVGMGFVFEGDDGSIYFQDGENNNKISRLTNTDKESYENTYGMNLIIYDNYLYYRDFGNGAKLMRMDIDNPAYRKVISDINTYQSIIVDDMIYANVIDLDDDKDGLYRMNLDGTNDTRLVKTNINCMQYDSGYIYYAVQAKGELFRIDLNGKNKQSIITQGTGNYIRTTHFIVEDGWIYFDNTNDDRSNGAVTSELNICRVKNDGTGFEELVNGRVNNLFHINGKKYLLYTTEDMLCMIELESLEVYELYNGVISDVNVLGNNIYVLDWQYETKNSIIYKIDMNTEEISVLGKEIGNRIK